MRLGLGATVAIGILAAFATIAPVWAEIECGPGEAAGRPLVEVPALAGEFRRSADGLVCWWGELRGEKSETSLHPAPYRYCLRLGSLGLGDTKDDVRRALTDAPVTRRTERHLTVEGHPVAGPEGKTVAHVFVATLGDRVLGLHLVAAGDQMDVPMGLSSIRPGDTAQQVLDVIGTPDIRCTDRDLDLQEWLWVSVPLQMQLLLGRVQAIGLGHGIPVGMN